MPFVTAVLPKLTAVAPVNPDPVIVTCVPPVAGPDDGFTVVTTGCGGGGTRANASLVAGPAPTAIAFASVPLPPGPTTWTGLSLPPVLSVEPVELSPSWPALL
jgi:hypothetical protein